MFFAITSMLGHILALFAVVPIVWTRAKPEVISNNPKKGDIVQLWNLQKNDTRAYNALFKSSIRKWYLTDEEGNILIPAIVTGPFSYSDRVAIQNAIWRITNNTCIRFIKRTDEKDYVDFINERGKGCYSMIGRVKGRAPLHLEHSERGTPSQATTYDLPYDNKSVMHYRKDEFAMPSKISIRTKDPNYQDVIGNVEDASPNDYLKICKIYGCKKCLGNS
uniref:Peptidase M12A domain-containing protein n=1 Tax=Haemonchus contortus TaxID=6289 RepID=A0A7I4XYJ0_HAECO